MYHCADLVITTVSRSIVIFLGMGVSREVVGYIPLVVKKRPTTIPTRSLQKLGHTPTLVPVTPQPPLPTLLCATATSPNHHYIRDLPALQPPPLSLMPLVRLQRCRSPLPTLPVIAASKNHCCCNFPPHPSPSLLLLPLSTTNAGPSQQLKIYANKTMIPMLSPHHLLPLLSTTAARSTASASHRHSMMGTRRKEGGQEEAEEEDDSPNNRQEQRTCTGLWDYKEDKDDVDKDSIESVVKDYTLIS